MKRKVMPLIVGLIVGLSVTTYFGYIEASLRAATQLRSDKEYAASADKLEALLPWLRIGLYRSQAMLKLAFNYHDLARYDRLTMVAKQLEAEFPGTIYGYYGIKFKADSLLNRGGDGDFAEAIDLYVVLLNIVKPQKNQETLHGLRERVLYDLAIAYRQGQNEEMFITTKETLKTEYPDSPYITEALHLK